MVITQQEHITWPLWRKIIFRFLFIYFTLSLAPWAWFHRPAFLLQYYTQFWHWIIELGNDHIFHVQKVLVYPNGSGDTSYNWAELSMILLLALVGCAIWSAIDFKRKSYTQLNYWLCLFVRYFVIIQCMAYGIGKLFLIQMTFPSLHQLATPLGDYLPMRLTWQFIGYSAPYQFLSGLLEVIAGLLLLYRRTVTLGLFIAASVFTNVMMLNLCYDIPVKIFSIQIWFMCLFSLANESKRLLSFLILNKSAAQSNTYKFNLQKRYLRVGRVVCKVIFIGFAVGFTTYYYYAMYEQRNQPFVKSPIKNGEYEVASFELNHKLPSKFTADSLAWQNVVFEDGLGSVKTSDSLFKFQYSRGYFDYFVDTLNRRIDFKRDYQGANYTIFSFHYDIPDSNTIKLSGKRGEDSLKVELKRSKHHFQLAEKQFHWLSEHNR